MNVVHFCSRDVSYIIYIPENYTKDFLNGTNPEIEIKSAGDGGSSYAEMILTRYVKVANIYQKETQDEEELIKNIMGMLLLFSLVFVVITNIITKKKRKTN